MEACSERTFYRLICRSNISHICSLGMGRRMVVPAWIQLRPWSWISRSRWRKLYPHRWRVDSSLHRLDSRPTSGEIYPGWNSECYAGSSYNPGLVGLHACQYRMAWIEFCRGDPLCRSAGRTANSSHHQDGSLWGIRRHHIFVDYANSIRQTRRFADRQRITLRACCQQRSLGLCQSNGSHRDWNNRRSTGAAFD